MADFQAPTSATVARRDHSHIEFHKNNLKATAAPTVSDDYVAGYSVGSRWIDTTNDKEYVCLDATAGAAVWGSTTESGGVTDHGALTGLADDDHTQYQKESEKSAASGYASLDATTKVPRAELGGAGADNTKFLRGDASWAVPSVYPRGTSFPASPTEGDVFYRTDQDLFYRYNGLTWVVTNYNGTLIKVIPLPLGKLENQGQRTLSGNPATNYRMSDVIKVDSTWYMFIFTYDTYLCHVFTATDPDGTWTYAGNAGLPANTGQFHFTKIGATYHCLYTNSANTLIGKATATDIFGTWTSQGTIISTGGTNDDGSSSTFDANGVLAGVMYRLGNMYFIYYGGFNSATGLWQIGLAYSFDLSTFYKSHFNPVVPVGATNQWDDVYTLYHSVYYNNGVFYLPYSGYGGAGANVWSIGIATSTDGFVFRKSEANPIRVGSGSGWDSTHVNHPHMVVDDDGKTFHIWHSGGTAGDVYTIGKGRIQIP